MDEAGQFERIEQFYGLKHDPFGSLVDAMAFSGVGGRYELVETLRHLLNYSPQDGLLIAPAGFGKRTLVQQVLKVLDDSWRIAWIDGSDIELVSELIQEIIGQFGLGIRTDQPPSQILTQINKVVSVRIESSENFLVVLQFADRLDAEIADWLVSLRDSFHVESRMKQLWLIESESELSTTLPEADWFGQRLNPMSLADAQKYLEDRFQAAGYSEELPISDKDLSRLHELSSGSPSKLNQLARDYLISATYQSTPTTNRFPLTHVIAGLGALVLVVIAFLYQQSDQDAGAPNEIVTLEESIDADGVEGSSTMEQRLADAVAAVEARQQAAQQTSDQTDAESDLGALTNVSEAVSETQQEPVEVASITNSEPAIPSESPEVVGVDEAASSDQEARLLDVAEADEFTLQLIGVRERGGLEALVDEFPAGAQTDIIESVFQQAPWYVLIYGRFADRAAAEAAIEELPAAFEDQTPWIRTFSSIREDLIQR